MLAKEYRKFYAKSQQDDDKLRDLDFIGCYYRNKNREILKKGFFNLYHGDKEDEINYLSSLLEIAEDSQSIYEFIQNAVDANATKFHIHYDKNYFLVINNGNKFSENDIKSLLNISQSTKTEDKKENKIGKFGIGFKLIHRLVGEGNGLNEITKEYKGPILFSWDKNYIQNFINEDLKEISKHWLFKILYTNFPCGMNERVKDKNYKEIRPFQKSEYNELVNFIKIKKIK